MTTGLAAGCGSGASSSSHSTHASSPAHSARAAPRLAASTASVSTLGVIRAWSDALRRGDVGAAARYFALPSVMVNGTDAAGRAVVITIVSRAEAEAANESLPCGARLISAVRRGRYVNALFRLTARSGPGGSDCGGGVGLTARTNFVVAHGLIVQWLRAADEPGDNPGVPPASPALPQASGPSV